MVSTEMGSFEALDRISDIFSIVLTVSAISCASASLSACLRLGYLDVASRFVNFLLYSQESRAKFQILLLLRRKSWHFKVFGVDYSVQDRRHLVDQLRGVKFMFFSVLLRKGLNQLVLV